MEAMLQCRQARIIDVPKGGAVFRVDGPAEYVGILLCGGVRVFRDDFDGNRAIQATIQPGELFGETFACAGVGHLPVSVEADRSSRVLLIRLKRIIETCPSACGFHNRVVLNLLKVLAAKNLLLNRKLEIVSRRTTREKLMAYLSFQARAAGSNHFAIPFDRQGLADYLGVDRSALSAEIGKLRREGVIESARSAFTLLR
jgi:CRP-like cAMP-binding protein